MDTLENSALILGSTKVVADAQAVAGGWSDDEQAGRARLLELGLARRKVEFYERLLAEGSAGTASGLNDADSLRDVLAGARARLEPEDSLT